MTRGRKRTGGLMIGMPSPMDRVEYAAKDLARSAVEAQPGLKALEARLKSEAMTGARKVLGKLGSPRAKK